MLSRRYANSNAVACLRVSLGSRSRLLSSRASGILSALDIPTSGSNAIPGVYNGSWTGTGEPLESTCPSTGEVLAHVSTVRSVSCVGLKVNGRVHPK